MYLQGVESVYDLAWTKNVTYGNIYHQNEVEQSRHNFEASNAEMLLRHFSDFEGQSKAMPLTASTLSSFFNWLRRACPRGRTFSPMGKLLRTFNASSQISKNIFEKSLTATAT